MKRSHVQTGALLAAGLAIALVVHYWPSGGESTEAIPAVTDSPTPSISISATPEPSASPTPSMSLSPSPSASPSASPSLSPSPSPTPSDDATEASTAAVSGLEVARNNSNSVMVRWDPTPGAQRYAVYSNGALLTHTTETMAIFIWETQSLRIGIAAETSAGLGPVSSVTVERPGQPAPTTSAPRPTPPAPDPTTPAPDPTPTTPPTVIPPPPSSEPVDPGPSEEPTVEPTQTTNPEG